MNSTQQSETKRADNLAWRRLQNISETRALELWRGGSYGIGEYNRKTGGRTSFSLPEEIRENVETLKRGNDDEIKARLMWYMTYFPAIWGAAIETLPAEAAA